MKKFLCLIAVSAFLNYNAQDVQKAEECFKKANYKCAEEQYTLLADQELISKIKAQHYNHLGVAQRRLGKTDLAFKSFENAVRTDPNNLQAYINLSSIHSQRGSKTKALDYIKTGLLIDDANADLYLTRAKIYEDLGKKDLAEKDLQHIISIAPDNYIAKTNYATFKKNTGKLEEAMKDYNSLISLKPESLLYNNRGEVYFLMKKYKEALADVNKAIALDPKFSLSYVTKTKILLETGNSTEACKALQKAVDTGHEKYLIGELLQKCPK